MDIEDQLGRFCKDLGFLRARASAAGVRALSALEQLAQEAAEGRLDGGWTARLVDLCRQLGIPEAGPERAWPPTVSGPGSLLPAGPGPASVDRYRCPTAGCSRYDLRQPGGPEPVCALWGETLTLVDLP
ncbi:hypothetical protein Kisp01_24960 [Kineosporia sp. NBRC 101677]|uniref:hypothetical protein n=1 Tax=Kineosporia sp. NBRC 101677 TaxID=3032197 RepID=UPI0024A2644D|nr:hypothetical protein [Kineosporia sp. NBRC 101677]GLY15481.1 hypothetical protein Kisp01_24960 [Kineosporia sp. NBRC 101677]